LATFENQLYVGCDAVNLQSISGRVIAKIEVYDTDNWSLQRQLQMAGLGSQLYGLAACSSNKCLYVSGYTMNCVHKVDLSTYDVTLKWSVAANPTGLSINSAHNVLVACSGANKIQEYSSDGLLIREIRISDKPSLGIQLSNGQIVVSQTDQLHRICKVKVGGRIVKSYGRHRGSGTGELNFPYSFAVDKTGYIIVVNHGDFRIVALNPSLTEVRDLPLLAEANIRYPFALYLDESRGRLNIGENYAERRVVVFDNVCSISALFNN
jgi:hypothetical protein